MKKPPFIKLYVKDFSFDTHDMSDEELGAYMREFLRSYKSGKVSQKNQGESIFLELKNSLSKYMAVCERNRENRTKSKSCNNESSTNGQRVVNDLVNQEPLTKNQEPLTRNIPPIIPQGVDVDLWNDFLDLRKSLKAKNTERALNLLVSKINSFTEMGYNPNSLIENAIEGSWKTVYEPKAPKKGNDNGKTRKQRLDEATQRGIAEAVFGEGAADRPSTEPELLGVQRVRQIT